MAKITYANKEFLNENEQISNINKVTDTDLNEIKAIVNENDDEVGNLSDLNTTDKSSIVNAINEINSQVVYDGGLTSATSTINISNLDLLGDGGTYKFEAELWLNNANGPDLQITFNDSDENNYNNYIYAQSRIRGTLTGDGTLVNEGQYYSNKNSISNWMPGPPNTNFPTRLQGEIYLMQSDVEGKYKIYFNIKYCYVMSDRQVVNETSGMFQRSVDNLNSIKIFSGNDSFLYTTKSKITIRKN